MEDEVVEDVDVENDSLEELLEVVELLVVELLVDVHDVEDEVVEDVDVE